MKTTIKILTAILLLQISYSSNAQYNNSWDKWNFWYKNTGIAVPVTLCTPADTDMVAAGCYVTVTTQAASATFSECIMYGQKYRIRQAGTLKGITFYGQKKTTTDTTLQVMVVRKIGTLYTRIGTTEDIMPLITAGQNNTIRFTRPIEGCQEGDFYGFVCNPPAPVLNRITDANATFYYKPSGASDSVDYAWESQFYSNYLVPATLYMSAPNFIFIGDSQISNGCSGLQTAINSLYSLSIPYKVGNSFGYTYQNMGISGNSTTQINTRFIKDVVDEKPQAVIQNGGINDIIVGTATTTIIANWRNMIEVATGNSIRFYGILIYPCSAISNAKMQQRDTINEQLKTIITSNGGYWIDAGATIGVYRDTGDAGNLWNINPAYDLGDGIHLNEAGNTALSNSIISKIQSCGCPSFELNATIPIDTTGMNNYWTSETAFGTIVNWKSLKGTNVFTQAVSAKRPIKTTAVLFDSTDVLTASINSQTTAVSLEMIIKITDTNSYAAQLIAGIRYATPTLTLLAYGITTNAISGALKFGVSYYNGVTPTNKTYYVAPLYNKYTHIVIVADSVNKQSVYFNGVLQTSGGSAYSTGYTVSGTVAIGSGLQNALVRNFMTYRVALNADTILSHYNTFNNLGLIDH